MRWSVIRDVVEILVVGVVILALIGGLVGLVVWYTWHQGEEARARHDAGRERAADLFDAFAAISVPAPESTFQSAIERTSDRVLVPPQRVTLTRFVAGADRTELTVEIEIQYVPRDSAYVAWSAYCFDYTLARTGAGAPDYREVECAVAKPLICELLGEDCKPFGLARLTPGERTRNASATDG